MGVVKPTLPILNTHHPLAQGFVIGWPMHEGAGTTLHSVGPHRLATSFNSGITWGVSRVGRELVFDNSHYVDIGDKSWLEFTNEFSLVVSFSTTSSGFESLAGKSNSDSNRGYQIDYEGGGEVRFILKDDTSFSVRNAGSGLNDGLPHQVIGTMRGTALELYVDGVSEGTGTGTDPLHNTESFLIGSRCGSSQPLNGNIQYVYVYSRQLAAHEVRLLYANPYQMFLPQSYVTLAITASPSPAGTTDIELTWTDNAESEEGYELERTDDGGSTWDDVTDAIAADAESYTDSDIPEGQTYQYRLRALNATKGDSEWTYSNEVTV